MAWLEFDDAAERYRIRFRFDGRQYKRSLKTADGREARAMLGRIEETILLIERGRITLPENADPATFILSDGKRTGEKPERDALTLKTLFTTYTDELPKGVKEESTLQGEGIHIKHLLKHLRSSATVQNLTVSEVQGYVKSRAKDKWRGKPIRSETIKKELTTLRLIWNWAVEQGYLTGPSPVRGIKYPKLNEKQIFRTTQEIQQIVSRGGISEDEERELWDGLYLTRVETGELLAHVEAQCCQSFVYPMFLFAAHTGARRSEILRSRIDDIDFMSMTVQIREKKKSRSKAMTFRRVDLTTSLARILKSWFNEHPGGQYTISADGLNPLTVHTAHDKFKRALKGTKWGKVRGFHVLRHSFASNLAAGGVDGRIISEFMGHTTLEMERRYRHLMPDIRKRAIELLVS